MRKIFSAVILFILLFLNSITFGQNEYRMQYPTITLFNDTLSVLTMRNRYYFAAIKAPDSLYSITTVKFNVGNHRDSLGTLTDGAGVDLTYIPKADKWISVEPRKLYPYKIIQVFLDSADSNYVGAGWIVITRKY